MNIVITGAGRGIGLELTRQLIGAGHRVFATRRNPANTTDLMALMMNNTDLLSLHSLEVTRQDSCNALAEDLGDETIDILINNAGVLDSRDSSIDTLDLESFAKVLEVNTLGPLRVMQSLMVHLRRSTSPVVLNISSQMGSLAGSGTGAIAYRTSKAALNKAMSVVAQELKIEKIRVINAHPGWVRTDMGGQHADIVAADSAAGLIRLLDKGLEDSGKFFNYSGEELPW